MSQPVLALFKRLQTALYIASRSKNLPVPTTSVTTFADGDIGPGTVALARKLAAIVGPNDLKLLWTLASLDGTGTITIKTLSENADQLTPELERFATAGSPSGAGAISISPQPGLPSASVNLPNVPQQNVGVNVQLPTLPNMNPYSLSPSGEAPAAGPRITVVSPAVTVPGPNPNAGSDPSGAGYPAGSFAPPPAKPPVSMAAVAGLGLLGLGLVGGLVWALRRR